MKFLVRWVIVLLRLAAKQPRLAGYIYQRVNASSFDDDRKQRLLKYVFSDATLRRLKKADVKAERARLKASRRGGAIAKTMKKQAKDRKRVQPNARRNPIVSFAIWTLRLLAAIGLGVVARFAIGFGEVLGVSSEKLDDIYMRVFGRVRVLKTKQLAKDIRQVEDLVKGRRPADPRESLRRLASFKEIHVFVEPGALVPGFLASDDFSRSRLVFYSLEDISQQVQFNKIKTALSYAPLRDRFNEISDEGKKLFSEGQVIAKSALKRLQKDFLPQLGALTPRQNEAVHTAMDGRISTRLSLANCFLAGLKAVPRDAATLFVAAGDTHVINGWGMFQPLMRSKSSFIIFATPNAKAVQIMYQRLDEVAKGEPDPAGIAIRDAQDRPTRESLEERFSELFGILDDVGERLATNIANALGGDPCCLFLHGERAPAYIDTLKVVGRELIQRNLEGRLPLPVFVNCSAGKQLNLEVSDLLLAEPNSEGLAIDFSAFRPTIEHAQKAGGSIGRLSWYLRDVMEGGLRHERKDVSDFLRMTIARAIGEQLLWQIAAFSLAYHLSHKVEIRGALASPSRNWLVRSFCAALLDDKERPVDVIDIQSMNTLAHPKYRAPMSSKATVIDDVAASIYSSYFKYPSENIILAGAPQNDIAQMQYVGIDRDALRARHGIESSAKVILLASQLQPIERMQAIVRPLAELVRDTPGLILGIRPHPRETSERLAAYKATIQELNAGDRVYWSGSESATEALAMSDVCVTIYSNMAREAAMFGIPVVTANYFDWQPPMRLDKEGLATASFSQAELGKNILKALEIRSGGQISNAYLDRNPHILEGRAAQIIVNCLEEAQQKFGALTTEGRGEDLSLPAIAIPEPLRWCESASVVCTNDINLAELPPIFREVRDLTVFSTRLGNDRGVLPKWAVLDRGGYNVETAKSFEEGVEYANQAAWACVDAVGNALQSCGVIHQQFNRIRRSFWLRIRARLIREQGDVSNVQRGIEISGSRPIVLCSRSVPNLRFFIEHARKVRGLENVYVLDVERNLSWRLVAAEQYLQELPEAAEGETIPEIAPAQLNRLAAELNEFVFELLEMTEDVPKGRRVLATTDWNLKTVPATVEPVLSKQLQSGHHVVVCNMTQDYLPEIQNLLERHKQRPEQQVSFMTPGSVLSKLPELSPRSLKWLGRVAKSDLVERDMYKTAAPDIRAAMAKNVDAIARMFLREHLGWYNYCRAFFRDRFSASVACPGRQWHADVAHVAAEANDAMAMTLQNAYMTAGYTYTSPTGNYITAIDDWTRDLFVNFYKIPEELVHVVSTPRFDYLKALTESADESIARKVIGVQQDRPVILFAAQVGFEAEGERITRALARITTLDGKEPIVIVKLHPRTAAEQIQRFKLAADAENPDHHVRIVQSGDIADYLAASSVVLTIYSNVGIEAAVMGKPLVIVNLSELPLPVPMDQFGIGCVARNEEDVVTSVNAYFDDPEFARVYAEEQAKFRDQNPAMVGGTSLQLISRAIQSSLDNKFQAYASPQAAE